jgi:hypothetical protein
VCDRQDDVGTISVLDVTVLIITVCDIPVFHRMAQTEVIRILTTSSESFCRHSELICTDPDGNSAASQNLVRKLWNVVQWLLCSYDFGISEVDMCGGGFPLLDRLATLIANIFDSSIVSQRFHGIADGIVKSILEICCDASERNGMCNRNDWNLELPSLGQAFKATAKADAAKIIFRRLASTMVYSLHLLEKLCCRECNQHCLSRVIHSFLNSKLSVNSLPPPVPLEKYVGSWLRVRSSVYVNCIVFGCRMVAILVHCSRSCKQLQDRLVVQVQKLSNVCADPISHSYHDLNVAMISTFMRGVDDPMDESCLGEYDHADTLYLCVLLLGHLLASQESLHTDSLTVLRRALRSILPQIAIIFPDCGCEILCRFDSNSCGDEECMMRNEYISLISKNLEFIHIGDDGQTVRWKIRNLSARIEEQLQSAALSSLQSISVYQRQGNTHNAGRNAFFLPHISKFLHVALVDLKVYIEVLTLSDLVGSSNSSIAEYEILDSNATVDQGWPVSVLESLLPLKFGSYVSAREFDLDIRKIVRFCRQHPGVILCFNRIVINCRLAWERTFAAAVLLGQMKCPEGHSEFEFHNFVDGTGRILNQFLCQLHCGRCVEQATNWYQLLI